MAKLNIRLKADQVVAVRYAEKHHYSICGYRVGKGKTIIGMALGLKRKTLIVCPAFLRLNWQDEYANRVDGDLNVKLIATKQQAASIVTDNTDVIITSYSMLAHIERLFTWAELVIADEFHLCKNPKANRTDLFDKYLYEAEVDRFLGLTGSPIKNGTDEWYQLLKMCDYNPHDTSGAHIQFNNQFEFAKHFCKSRLKKFGNRRVTDFYGIRNETELNLLLKSKYLKSPPDKLDGGGLPAYVKKNVLASKERNMELFEAFKSNTGKDISAKAKAAEMMIPFTVKYVKALLDEGVGQIVLFSDHRKPVEEFARLLGAETIMGGDSMERRKWLIDRFQKGKLQILAGTIGAMSVGLTLTAACNVVFNDLPWVPGDLEQAEGRIHRIGQTKACTSHRLLGSPQAKHILNIITDKSKTIRRSI